MDHFEKFEEQLISSYESTLAAEGREICEEIDSIYGDNVKLLVAKADTYCLFSRLLKEDEIDKKLREKCEKYLSTMNKYRYIQNHFEYLFRSRKHKFEVKV